VKQRYRQEQEQIIAILQEAETAPTKAEVCRKYGISEPTYYRWRQLYGGLDVPHLRRLKQLEAENARLKRLVVEQMLAHETLKEVLGKRGCA
jgi:putative transposase